MDTCSDGLPLWQHQGVTLYAAAAKGHGEVVDVLIKCGCDVDKAKNTGATPLLIAAQNGHGEVVEELLKAGCDVDKPRNGCTTVCTAADKGHGEVVEALLKAGCDTSFVRSVRGGQVRCLFVADSGAPRRAAAQDVGHGWRAARPVGRSVSRLHA